MGVEKTIDDVQKLFALAKDNATQSEVETAIAQAQELMIKNNLSLGEIDLETVNAKKKYKDYITEVGTTKWWIKDLSNIIGCNFKCTSVICERRSRKSQMGYVGIKEDVELACIVFKFAVEHCQSCTENYIQEFIKRYNKDRRYHLHITKTDCKEEQKMFIKRYVLGIRDKLKEQVKNNNWRLMIVKDSLILDYEKGRRTVSHKRPDFKNEDNGRKFDKGENITYIDTSYKTSSHLTTAFDEIRHDVISKELNNFDFSILPLDKLSVLEVLVKDDN